MSRNDYENEQHSVLPKLLAAAATISAGAFVIYRAGLTSKAAKMFDMFNDVRKSSKNWLPRKSFNKLTFSDVKQSYQNLRHEHSNIKNDYNSRPLRIDANSSTSFLAAIQAHQIAISSTARWSGQQWQAYLAREGQKFVRDNFKDAAKSSYEKWEKFINDIVKNTGNVQHMHDSIQRFDFNQEEQNIAIQILEHVKAKAAAEKDSVKESLRQDVRNQTLDAFKKFMSVDNLEKVYGSIRIPTKQSNFLKKLFEEQSVTIRDLLNQKRENIAVDSFTVQKKKQIEKVDPIEVLRNMHAELEKKDHSEAERFLDIYVDKNNLKKTIRGEMYSFSATRQVKDDFLGALAETLPGTLLKARYFQYRAKSPVAQFIRAGSYDPVFAARTGSPQGDHEVKDSYLRINKNFYKLTKDGVQEVQGLDDLIFVSGRYSFSSRVIRQMMQDTNYKQSDNKVLHWLDLFQDREIYQGKNVVEGILDNFRKETNPEWRGNIFKRILNPNEQQMAEFDLAVISENADYAKDYVAKANRVNLFFERNTYSMAFETIDYLKNKTSNSTRELLEIISEGNNSAMLEKFIDYAQISKTFQNPELSRLLQRYISDPSETLNMIKLKTDRSHLSINAQLTDLFNVKVGNETENFYDILRNEISKEAFIRYAQDSTPQGAKNKNYEAVLELFQDMERGTERTNAERLAHLAILQDKTGIQNIGARELDNQDVFDIMNRFEDVMRLSTNQREDETIRQTFSELQQEGISDFESFSELYKESDGAMPYNKWIAVGKTVDPRDLLRVLNDDTKLKATFKKMYKQFNAGSADPENLTEVSMIPYFLLSRLSDDLNKVGLGFSRESMGSTFDLLKNLMMKRVLPVVIGSNYYEYLDDTSQDITGTSITGAMAKGTMNIDLAARKTLDTFGMTEWLKEEKAVNPIMQYWGDHNEFMSYDELRKWYESGYEPVRRGAWWIFGSVNEARGGEIAYWQPSYVRRIESDYEDISLYGGNSEKWRHSWLPTPTYPLSPLRAFLNPNWLEKMHEDDRPYVISGSLFEDGTPWGAVLNPTVGRVLKPKEELHPWRLRNGVDVKNLLREMNEYIKDKARDYTDNNLVLLDGSNVTAVNFTSWNALDPDTSVDSYQLQEGYGNGIGYGIPAGGGSSSYSGNDKIGDFRVSDNDYEAIQDAKDMLRNINEAIKKKPQKNAKRGEFDKEKGIITPERLKDYQPSRGMKLLNHPDEIAELINEGDSYNFIKNAAISNRLVTGIYGYILGEATGIGVDNKKMIPTSQDMTSFSRSFWDSNIGGAGGDAMEIIRRVIPDFRRSNRVSPLLNEMPEWLPERFRFGDPFTSLPKGEMRLPGAGYESLNHLHPDQFGEYGAFDRYKILADIAPFTPEYKIWRDIAKKTVTDPKLIEEMQEIRDRVTQQGKTHDFYDYKLLNRNLEYHNVVVSEVLGNGKFKSGDNTVFKVAGIRVKGNNDETAADVLNRYIHVGDTVTVAIDERVSYRRNKDADQTINAAVYSGGKNISKLMLENGDAIVRKGDTSSAALLSNLTPMQTFLGTVSEIVAHADVPWLSDQFLRVRSPMEAYKAEEIYGTPYQTWNHPISSFLMPALERAVYENHGIVTPLITFAYNVVKDMKGIDPLDKKIIAGTYLLANRGAFIGAAVSYLIYPLKAKKAMAASEITSTLVDVASVWQGGHSYFDQSFHSALIGDSVARFFEKDRTKGALIGALTGATIRTLRGGSNYDYIPERIKKKWALEEHFDRLTHLKYMGLYHAAAQKALEEEGVDVEEELEKREWLKNRKDELSGQLEALGKSLRRNMRESPFRDVLLSAVNSRIDALKDKKTLAAVGPYTHSAILYKQAAEQTMTGLKKGATWSQIISALPKNDREYFTEFIKERDPSERLKILKTVSPFLRKALNLAWYGELPDEQSDEQYFKKSKLPLPDAQWQGWRPDVNLSNVQVKTIENEGLLLSDFGYYESELRKPEVINAPTLGKNKKSSISVGRNIKEILHGAGLKDVEVNVTEGAYGTPTQITSDIRLYMSSRKSAEKIRRTIEENVA